jgi:hypothetical protein
MHVRLRTPLLGVLVMALAAPAMAQGINGAIFTTTVDGKKVNGNIYAAKADVYLNGGPQNEHPKGLDPDEGIYYFQVTDPSGETLLSTDDYSCRQVYVSGGKIVGVPSSVPATCETGFHPIGDFNPDNGQTPVQLMPFDDTSNPGGDTKCGLRRSTGTSTAIRTRARAE